MGDLPFGYDHKYTYSHIGYNLKITDMQSACALAQLDRLPGFIAARKANFAFLHQRLAHCEPLIQRPVATPGSDPAWFGYPITLGPEAPVRRIDLLDYLDQQRIGTRLLFAGNLTRQPSMAGARWRISGSLTHTDRLMRDTFWIGLWPGLSEPMLEHAAGCIESFVGVDP
jgi:CDP-6-deoxy-D-xylo-4-hexulose-3-dehydrase